MYKVIVDFADLQDKEHVYRAGDNFPRSGFSVSEERLKELASAANKRGYPLIKEVDEKQTEAETKKTTKRKSTKPKD